MRKCALTACMLLAGILSTRSPAAEETVTTVAKKGWHHNYAAAYHEARRLGKPLVVHFYTDWCGPCRQMEASTLNTPQVTAELGRSIVGVKVNADHHARLTRRFGVSGYPTDVFVGADGNVLFRSSGFTSSRGYATQIAQANARASLQLLASSTSTEVDPDAPPALDGYSPVAIIRDKAWDKGSDEFACEYAGDVYHLQNAAELALFRADPERYVPELSGHDPLELSSSRKAVPGDIRYGVFYRGKLYLLTNDENRQKFMNAARRIADAAERLRTAAIKASSQET